MHNFRGCPTPTASTVAVLFDHRTSVAESTFSCAGNLARGVEPPILEKVFTVITLFYTTGAILPFITGNNGQTDSSQINPIDSAIKAAIYTVVFVFISQRLRSFARGLRKVRWIVVLGLVALASALWSEDPSLTVRGSAVLLATTAFGIYFGTRYTVHQQLHLLSWTFLLVIASSFFFAIFLPEYGIEQGINGNFSDWQGAFAQKNILARAIVLAILVFLFAGSMRRSLRWLAIAGSVVLLGLSGSATGMIVCFGIIVTLPLYNYIKNQSAVPLPVIGFGLLLAASLFALTINIGGLLHLVNKSPDLTGRTELWNAVMLSISKRPWLGYGFSAFWSGTNAESALVRDSVGWTADYAHDGFLDVLLQVGVVGLATFLVGYLVLWRRALALLMSVAGFAPVWLCTYLVFMLLYNLTEGSILAQNSIYWVLYVSTAVSLVPGSLPETDSPLRS